MHLRHALSALALAASLSAQAAGFSDATLDPADYTRLAVHTDPTVTVTVAAITDANPGAGLGIQFTNTGAPVNLESLIGFVYRGFGWNPATQGALAGIDFSNDRYIDGGDDFINLNLVAFSRALVVQGGQAYVARFLDPVQLRGAWYTSSASGLKAADFGALDLATGTVDGARHPDFAASGGALQFGFANRLQLDTVGNAYALNASFRFDNLRIDLQPAPVPEPATALLMLAGAGLLAVRRFRAGASA